MSQLVVGNYTLGELLGRGGMSEVYAARHNFLGDAVAVKLVRGDGSAEMAEALVAEAAGTRAIQHPNVVQVLDVGRDPRSGCCYLVMERVEGENLAARLRRVGRMDERAVRALGAAIADGMQAAHARGIVHRDLKPANVMLRGDAPKIVDFGIAKHLGDQSAVTTGRRIGTPSYMAPEQLTGGLIAPCVDVWALGVILFEAVTGKLPFDGYDDGRCPQLFETAPPAADVSPELAAIIAQCLEREPGRRPRSMAEVAAELRGQGAEERRTQDLGPVNGPAPRRAAPPLARGTRKWVIAALALGLITLAVIAALAWPSPKPATEAATGTETEAATGTGTETEAATETEAGSGVPERAAEPHVEGRAPVPKKKPKSRPRIKRTPPTPGEGLD